MTKREEKFPETATFRYYNANPKNRLTTDCVIRAISTAMQIKYETVVRDLTEMQIKTGYDVSSEKCYGRYLEEKGWRIMAQPRKGDNTKYTGKEFCKHVKYPAVIAHIGGNHIVAIMQGKVWDTWDSTGGCIGKWWIKE